MTRADAARTLPRRWPTPTGFFEDNSGWAPPDDETLAEWVADGVCRCPDECLVAPDVWCEHGLASWWPALAALGDVEVPSVPPVPPAPPVVA